MSGTDEYRPSKRIEVVQVRQEFVNVPVRKYVGMEHDEKRAAASARVLHNADAAEQDWREQIADALLTPEYTGPVGTRRNKAEHTHSIDCLGGEGREVRLSTCEYGCKVYDTKCGELIFHSSVYGHMTYSVEVAPVTKVEHVAPKDARMLKREKALAARKQAQQQARAAAARIREDERREREMRDLGFGSRTGISL